MPLEQRNYDPADACVFRSTKAQFGGLSNMAAGFPIAVGKARARTSEALYQVCRFPHHPDVQALVLAEASPMAAKLVSRRYDDLTRPDWNRVRIAVMRWCLAVKLAQHFEEFGCIFESTGTRDIVESSRRDDFWGAKPTSDGKLVGRNALGRLLMELRARYMSPSRYALLIVRLPRVPRFEILGEPVELVDGRQRFLDRLHELWTQEEQAARDESLAARRRKAQKGGSTE